MDKINWKVEITEPVTLTAKFWHKVLEKDLYHFVILDRGSIYGAELHIFAERPYSSIYFLNLIYRNMSFREVDEAKKEAENFLEKMGNYKQVEEHEMDKIVWHTEINDGDNCMHDEGYAKIGDMHYEVIINYFTDEESASVEIARAKNKEDIDMFEGKMEFPKLENYDEGYIYFDTYEEASKFVDDFFKQLQEAKNLDLLLGAMFK